MFLDLFFWFIEVYVVDECVGYFYCCFILFVVEVKILNFFGFGFVVEFFGVVVVEVF